MKRSLVLAGGGMRVSWQAGVVLALEEEGIEFQHRDGTSGGIMTVAMLASGLSADEMIERWRHVEPSDFASMLPIGDYLRGPWALPALSGADGIVDRVFPALGIDLDAVRATAVDSTFTVADFTRKRTVAVPADRVDAELLAAGMSLPIFTTPLHRDGTTWTDAVWIRDAGIDEAIRRDADEIWLVWCIGNTAYWGDGPLEQYVHMIEMSATGALTADLAVADAAGRRFVLHVVRPEHPLPLDPEYSLGWITADELIGMGYRDAVAMLAGRTAEGVPHDGSCTAMTEQEPGIRWTEELRGRDGTVVLLHVEFAEVSGGARVTGFLHLADRTDRRPLAEGVLERDGAAWRYRARVRLDGEWHRVVVERVLKDDLGWDAWADATTARLTVDDVVDVEVRLDVGAVRRLLASIHPIGSHGLRARGTAVARAVRAGLHGLARAHP